MHFFGYPYGFIKRYKKFSEPLNLKRAKWILFSPEEKKLYESIASYLLINLKKEDKMVVLGYCPQISFLTERKNIFENEEFIFERLEQSQAAEYKSYRIRLASDLLETKIISNIKKERPKIILVITGNVLGEGEFHSSKVKDYIQKNYSLDKVFGPGDIHGLGGFVAWVKIFYIKGDNDNKSK